MDSVILFGSQSDTETLNSFFDAMMASCNISVIMPAGSAPVKTPDTATVFSGEGSTWDSLTAAAQIGRSEYVTLINVSSGIRAEDMAAIAQCSMPSSRTVGTFSSIHLGFENTASHLCAADLPQTLTQGRSLPLFALKISRKTLLSSNTPEVQSVSGIICSLLISAIADFQEIETDLVCIQNASLSEESLCPSQLERAALLRQTVSTVNIEDLFPNKPWESAQTETAASCYQILAAQFISLNDLNSAEECITLSEQLEDTPRSLALKGIVAMLKGEELEAVANMVSSLQEYERSKKENQAREMTVNPSAEALEVINTSLQSGLEALNARNNAQAANHFAAALFRFDSFFSESGLRMPQ